MNIGLPEIDIHGEWKEATALGRSGTPLELLRDCDLEEPREWPQESIQAQWKHQSPAGAKKTYDRFYMNEAWSYGGVVPGAWRSDHRPV